MIFRTGSVLIVGRCDENVLLIVYEFLKIILNNEYKNISQQIKFSPDLPKDKEKDKDKENLEKVSNQLQIIGNSHFQKK